MSQLFEIKPLDIFKGVVTAVLAAVITTLYGYVTQTDFNFFTTDWSLIGSDVLKVSFTAFLAYMMKNFFSASNTQTETVLGVQLEKK